MDNIELDSIDVAAYIAKEAVIKNYYIDLTKLQKYCLPVMAHIWLLQEKDWALNIQRHGLMDLYSQEFTISLKTH